MRRWIEGLRAVRAAVSPRGHRGRGGDGGDAESGRGLAALLLPVSDGDPNERAESGEERASALSRAAGDATTLRVNRRQFLQRVAAGAALLAFPGGVARAIGPGERVRLQRARYSGAWSVNPGAETLLSEEIRLRTSIDMAREGVAVDLTSKDLFGSLFTVFAGNEPFTLTDGERAALKRWIGLGGLLVFDNCGQTGVAPGYDESVRRELGKMFPQEPISRVSPEHVLYRTFYRLDYPAGRAINKPFVEGMRLGKRYAVILNPNDLTGALARDPSGRFLATPTPGGENQREMAIRFGVNLMMYATCLHYKDDQVHIDTLLHSRKWKIRPPE